MNFSEAKILVVPGYMVDIPGSAFPTRIIISFLSTVRIVWILYNQALQKKSLSADFLL
jgi:hypothetical protein